MTEELPCCLVEGCGSGWALWARRGARVAVLDAGSAFRPKMGGWSMQGRHPCMAVTFLPAALHEQMCIFRAAKKILSVFT